MAERREKVEIAGRCDSACTIYLANPGTCVRATAVLGFHRPAGGGPAARQLAETYMLSAYPEPVRQWIRANGGLRKRVIYLRGEELRQSVPLCAD